MPFHVICWLSWLVTLVEMRKQFSKYVVWETGKQKANPINFLTGRPIELN